LASAASYLCCQRDWPDFGGSVGCVLSVVSVFMATIY
jgi:hypothetical protein